MINILINIGKKLNQLGIQIIDLSSDSYGHQILVALMLLLSGDYYSGSTDNSDGFQVIVSVENKKHVNINMNVNGYVIIQLLLALLLIMKINH